MERYQNIKNSINNAKYIKIIFPENPSNDIVGSVLALHSMFKQLDKDVFLLEERLPQRAKNFLTENKRKIMITLNEDIDEIYYEKKGSHVDLNIVPKNRNFDTKNFSWEIVSEKTNNQQKINQMPDLILIIGIARFNEVEKFLPTDEEELFACTIVNIDNNPNNENYGDINVIEKSSLSKIISFLVRETKNHNLKDVFDFLLFGFFSQDKISLKDLSAIKWLINNGASLNIWFEYQKEKRPLWADYLEFAIKNISIREDVGIIFSHLKYNEEIKDNEKVKNILQVSKIFREWIGQTFFLSFRDEEKTKTIFYSPLSSTVNEIREKYNGSFKDTGGIIVTPHEDPVKAIEELKKFNYKTTQ
ncbi:hypothetical protein M0R01_02995 [bacterium]|nr:hypothetical protein [bacterium]